VLGFSALLLAACSAGSAQTTSCGVAGLVQSCTCPSGTGTQTCQISGAWDVCACNVANTGGAGHGANAGHGGNATGGSSGGAGTGPHPSPLDGGTSGDHHDMLDAGDASVNGNDAAASPPKLYSACTTNADCGGDKRTCYQNPFAGFPGGGGNSGNTGYCTTPCTSANDCPEPGAPATAVKACGSQGFCELVCTMGKTCPDSLQCQGGICF
jgi:hypothetical protein